MLLAPSESNNISKIMHFIKRHTSRNINIKIGKTQVSKGKVGKPYLQREGGDYQPSINNTNIISKEIKISKPYLQEDIAAYQSGLNNININFNDKFIWQKRFHDRIIRNELEFNNAMEYVDHKNAYELAEQYNLRIDNNGIVDYPYYSYTNEDLLDEY